MKQYHDCINYILENGEIRNNRTNQKSLSVFGYQMRFDLNKGFPAITTKKLAWKAVVSELLWFLEGSTDERRLAEILYNDSRFNIVNKKTIWTANADFQGKNLGYENTDHVKELGPIYGKQWRNWQENNSFYDQISNVINSLKNNPFDRRHIVSAWNVSELQKMALPPCHLLFQFYISNDKKLSCQLYQRSVDSALGLPFNIASYSLLIHMIAQILDLDVGEFIHTSGDLHLYENHIDEIKLQLSRSEYSLPTLEMPKFKNLEELLQTTPAQYKLLNYKHHDTIKMNMVV